MKRREFIAGSAGLLTYAISSRAMAWKQWRIGEVFGGNPGQIFASALSQALLDLGYIDGKDIRLQTRFAAPSPDGQKEAILALLPISTCSLSTERWVGLWPNRWCRIFRSWLLARLPNRSGLKLHA